MKKLILGAVFVAAGLGSASAADMAVKSAAVVARPSCAAQQFGGGYVGIHGGSSYHTGYRQNPSTNFLFGADEGNTVTSWGGLVGGQIGYNVANCNTLWGIELDGSWLSNDRTARTNPADLQIASNIGSRLDGLVTLRGRAGIALDNMLLYVTGGVAGVHAKTVYSLVGFAPPFIGSSRIATVDDNWNYGWVAGFGTEWAFGGAWSLRSEFLYIGTADKDYSFANTFATGVFAPGGRADFTHHDNIAIARIGLNYKFGVGKQPVVAKY